MRGWARPVSLALFCRLRSWHRRMAKSFTRIGISNGRDEQRPRVIYVEPWGRDYTLLPGEDLEIVAYGDTPRLAIMA